MSESEQKYFNFPVQLIDGFMVHSAKCLNNIFDYAVCRHSEKLEGSKEKRFIASLDWFGVTAGNMKKSIENGNMLIDSLPSNSPMAGITKSIFFDFYKNDKSDFEKICLISYLALKSIISTKPYSKITNEYWFSRMAGSPIIAKIEDLPIEISKYNTERLTRKIKLELSLKWGLVTYSRYTRGFYVSFSIPNEDLIYQVEKKRKTRLEKIQKEKEKQAYLIAMAKLNSS